MKNIEFAIAGILHDIGKFGQRADVSYYQSTELDAQAKEMARMICHLTTEGYYTHLHVLWTDQFMKNQKQVFGQLFTNELDSLINLAAYHHKPSTFNQAIITLADHWSSGIDRNNQKQIDTSYIKDKLKYKHIPLVSLFNKIKTSLNECPESDYGYDVQAINITNNIFPKLLNETVVEKNFKTLWQAFNDEFKMIKANDSREFAYTLFHILKKYTWYIPASTMDYPDSSLFEHSKLVGAFAHCFASYFEENPESYSYKAGGRIDLKDNQYPILMVCGDISGIQNFIYNISNKSAMKSLKGRSFYVQLLTETLCDELLDECGMSIINQVYSAGGKFYLFLPNTLSMIDKLENFKNKVQKQLFDEYNGTIALNMGWQPFALKKGNAKTLSVSLPNENELKSVSYLWNELADKTTNSKKNRFNHLFETQFKNMFEPFGYGGDVKICSVTGIELKKPKLLDKQYQEQSENDQTVLVSDMVYQQIKIGEKLYSSKHLIKTHEAGKRTFKISNTNYVLDEQIEHTVIQSASQLRFDNQPEPFVDHGYGQGFKFYGGLPMATFMNKTATLQDICLKNNAQNDKDYTKLGILRMDVDNLGMLFQNGFDEPSFSRMTTLSGLLEQFFSGYINTIKNQEKFKNNINIVYAGGDDVFAVGRWDLLMYFAIEIRQAFKKFVCNREDITLSAGIAIINPKFPIAKASDLAGEAENLAKKLEWSSSHEKNAFCVFDIALHWDMEMPQVIELKDLLLKWLSEKNISKGLLMKFFSYYELYKTNNISWRWQAAYSMARQEKENKQSSEVFKILKEILFAHTFSKKQMSFNAFIFACRWAELEHKLLNN